MRKPTDTPSPAGKNQAAAELGRRGGLKGGAARAAGMTPEERTEAARQAATARWARVAAQSEGDEGGKGRGRTSRPFVFALKPDEIEQITQTDVVGSGGLQSLQRRLKDQLENGNEVTFDNTQLGQLIRYMTQYGPGSFQTRLREAFIRSLDKLLKLPETMR